MLCFYGHLHFVEEHIQYFLFVAADGVGLFYFFVEDLYGHAFVGG